MRIDTSELPLFEGMDTEETNTILSCLSALIRYHPKGGTILEEGDTATFLGVVLSGQAQVSYRDVWGNCTVLEMVGPGEIFGELCACTQEEKLPLTVQALEDTSVLFLNMERVFSPCISDCIAHTKLIRNLLSVCARRGLQLSRRMLHTSSRSIRRRLLSYFSDCVKQQGGYTFQIPYDRQQLADYLGVDKNAMCNELSKMQRDGLIQYRKQRFTVLKTDE